MTPGPHAAGGSTRSGSLRVVIADDHPFYRAGLAGMLRDSGFEVVDEAANGEAAIRSAAQSVPDVLIMDLNMPGMSGVEATRRLAEHAPFTRVLVLSVSAQEVDVTEAILAGASGYVLKDGPVEEIVAAIRTIAAGRSFVSPGIAQMLLRRLGEATGTDLDPATLQLSDPEVEVLALKAEILRAALRGIRGDRD
jgi:DNA-binding NarL/FixJ family response regulator